MKLSVHLISKGRYYKAGTDIPDDELPEFASRYAVEAESNGGVDESYAKTLQQQRAGLDHVAKPKMVKREGQIKGKSFVKEK